MSLNINITPYRQELQEAKQRIEELKKTIECKEAEMAKMKENADQSLEEICMIRSDLEKCYETSKKLHDESTELKRARQDMLMNIERLKNELETWKTLHDEMKNRNDKLKRELKAVQCEDYSQKALQELLAKNRDDMDVHVRRIAELSSELGNARQQLARLKQQIEDEKCKSDPLRKYLEKGCELEKLTRYSPVLDTFRQTYPYEFEYILGSSWKVDVDSDDMELE